MTRRGFTLVEMLVAILLTAIVFTYLYGVLDNVRADHERYRKSVSDTVGAQRVYALMVEDIAQARADFTIVHESGYDRISFYSDHSVYGIPRPWIHYFVSKKDQALVRIESNLPIDFSRSDYVADANGTYFFADLLATRCTSLRFTLVGSHMNLMVRCGDIAPVVATLYRGDR